MKTITKISTQKKAGRYNIDLDGKFAFGVAESVLIKFGLAKGRELDEALIAEIQTADDVARALKTALNYLNSQLRTKKQVRTKLADQEIPADIADQVIEQLKELRYIDDLAYAQAFYHTKQQLNSKGPTVISQELAKVGVPKLIIEQALQAYTRAEELETAKRWLDKLYTHYRRDSKRLQQQKMIQALAAKGFHFDVGQEVVGDYLENQNDDEQDAQELVNVVRQAEKYWQRYRNLYDSQREFKTRQNLFAKGYSSELIDQAIDKLHE